jgi:hypothetical protein
MIDIQTLTFSDTSRYLPDASKPFTFEDALSRMMEEDDYWQDGRRYKGPLPAADDYVAGMSLIRKSYAPVLKVRECTNRHVRGVIGKEPQFETVLEGVAASKKERRAEGYKGNDVDALADAADDVQGDVWDERGEHKTAKLACRRLVTTRSVFLRYDVPSGFIKTFKDADGKELTGIDETDWRKAYRLTHMEVCDRDTASVVVDPETMKEFALYSYKEPVPGTTDRERQCVQISTVRDDGLTLVRIVRSDNSEPDEWTVDTGGFPLVLKAESEGIVTPDLFQLQDLSCGIATMVKINADVAGFPQVDLIDMEKREEEVPDPANPGKTKRVPVPMPNGPRTQRAHYSYVDEDKDGNVITTKEGQPLIRRGQISYREPVSSDPLRQDIEFFNTEIYRGFNQGHIATRRSANSSAELLVAERADYADSLLETKPDLEKLLRNVFKARLCMAAYLAKDLNTLAQFKAGRVRVDLRLNAGPMSIEEQRIVMERQENGLLSRETTMVLLGTEDTDSEIEKLDRENSEQSRLNSPPVAKAKVPVTPQLVKSNAA